MPTLHRTSMSKFALQEAVSRRSKFRGDVTGDLAGIT
jgi:hypothetical protein